ncbi:hypothetical protein BBJ29_009941 [Phytophthora kernoviae]|uniref:RxLR effector protein n=1 Tax=Phytophthora kernoviae TaxID=325452 RepID=A0A3R7HK12_9STRA|nr:hypothetical protein BBJ29_009941 [Phytophthora kernoviae]
MRPYCVLLLALVFLATFSNVVSEDTPATAQSLTTFTNVGINKRFLRTTQTTGKEDGGNGSDEERRLNLSSISEKSRRVFERIFEWIVKHLNRWWNPVMASYILTALIKAGDKIKAAKAAKVAKAVEKLKAAENKDKAMFASLLDRMVDPKLVYRDLGLKKLGPRAKESKYFDMYTEYGRLFAQRAQIYA